METKESLNFNLREPRKKGVTPLYAVVKMEGKQYKISTGLKILPYYWNEKKQSVCFDRVSRKDIENTILIQKALNQYRFVYLKYKTYICDKNIDSLKSYFYKHIVMTEIQEKTKSSKAVVNKPKATNLLIKAFDIYYNEVSEAKEGSKRQKRGLLNHFIKYCEVIGKDEVSMLSQTGLNDFQNYLLNQSKEKQQKGKKGAGNEQIKAKYNFCATLINNVLAVHSDFAKYKISKVEYSKLKVVKIEGEDKKKRPLMQNELDAITNVQGLTEEEKEYRDLFLLECYGSYRISDTEKMFDKSKQKHISMNGMDFLTFETQKEGITAVIWLDDKVKNLISRFDNGLKYADFKDQHKYMVKMNKNLQIIAKKAGLNKTETYKDSHGVRHEAPTHKIITSHWARYTFIYNGLFVWGLTSSQLKTFTAHADSTMIDEVYNVYAKSAEKLVEQAAKALQGAKFEGVSSEPAKPTESEAHEELFSYSSIKQIKGLLDTNISVINLPMAKQAINVIKDVSKLDNFKEIDFEKIKEISPVIFELSYLFYDSQLYLIYQYKLKHFGLPSDGYWDSFFNSEDDIAYIFQRKDEEEKTDSEIQAYENSHR